MGDSATQAYAILADVPDDLPSAVLFDFSGTLCSIESPHDAVRAALGADALHHVPALRRFGAINGSDLPTELPPHLLDVWARRDLSAADHRRAYSGSAEHAGLSADQAARLYARGTSPQAWSAYPDSREVLSRLRRRGVRTAVASNIGWDPRPVLAAAGLLDLVDVLVLSDERGLIKPDPAFFTLACR